MIKLIQSSKFRLPTVYLIETDEDLKELPMGLPFIRESLKHYDNCVRFLEWEVLWKAARDSGLPFNWKNLLERQGYTDLYKYGVAHSSGGDLNLHEGVTGNKGSGSYSTIDASTYFNDISYKVDIDLLQDLKLLPIWLVDNIEEALRVNIQDTILYNPHLYNKKLDLPIGSFEYASNPRNLLIIDISGSIPRSVSITILTLAKTLAEKFNADILITGSKSTLYENSELDKLSVDSIYTENGMDNDQVYFLELVKQSRKYKSVIVFGDNDQPGQNWRNDYNQGTKNVSREKGQELCQWDVQEIISFHTTDNGKLAGYALWFNCDNVTHVKNWVTDLN